VWRSEDELAQQAAGGWIGRIEARTIEIIAAQGLSHRLRQAQIGGGGEGIRAASSQDERRDDADRSALTPQPPLPQLRERGRREALLLLPPLPKLGERGVGG